MGGFLGIDDAAFWSQPLDAKDAVQERLLDAETEALLLDGPRRVPIDERPTLPVVVCHAGKTRRLRTHEVRRGAALVATRPGGAELLLARLVPADQLPPDLGPPPGPNDKVPGGHGAEMSIHDARALLQLPWAPGRWRLTVLLAAWAAEPLVVDLVAAPRFKDPAAEAFIARNRRPGYPQHIAPRPGPGVSYAAAKDGPAAPAAPGLLLAAPKVAVAGEGLTLRGALRRRPRQGEVVRPRAQGEAEGDLPEGRRWQDVGDERAKAVLTVTLVTLVGHDVAPGSIVLQVPSYDDPGDPAAPGEVSAHFTVDLQALGLDATGEVFVRAFSGDLMSDGLRVVLLTPDAMRGE